MISPALQKMECRAFLAVIIGVPIGLLTAIFLAKAAPTGVAGVIHRAVELLAGIPSVVYGLAGMIVLVPIIQFVMKLVNMY